MPLNQGTLISSPIRPLSPGMTIATALSNEVLGGLHSVQTLSDRDLITTDRRQFGMLVYIINDDDFYQLKQISSPDISDNLNWDLINISGVASTTEWLDSVISISGTPPGSPTLGERYLVSSGSGLWSGLDDYIVEWDGSNWNPTIPTEGTTIRVDDDTDAIFSFIQGVWTRYEFVKEPWTLRYDVPLGLTLSVSTGSQYLIYGDLNVDGGIDSWGNITILNGQLTGSGSVATFSFGTLQQIELLTEIIGATGITISTGGLGERIISTNLIAGTGISFSYGPGTEIEINSVFPTLPEGRPKYIIEAVETITVPDNELYYIYGDLEVRGTLDIGTAGKVVVTNGALIAASGSTINNVGNIEIYDLLTVANDNIKIDISEIKYGKEGRILFESELKYIPILGATARVVTETDDLVYSTSSSYPSSTSSTAFDRYLGISVADPLKKLHINGSGILIDGNESEQDLSLGDPNWARFVIDSGNSDTHTLMDLRNDEGRVLYVNGDIDGGFRFPSVSIGKTPSNTLFNVSDYYGNDYFSIGSTGTFVVGSMSEFPWIGQSTTGFDKFIVRDDSTGELKYRIGDWGEDCVFYQYQTDSDRMMGIGVTAPSIDAKVHILTTGQLASSASYVSAGLKVEVVGASAIANNVYSGDFSGGLGLITDNLLITGTFVVGSMSDFPWIGQSTTGFDKFIVRDDSTGELRYRIGVWGEDCVAYQYQNDSDRMMGIGITAPSIDAKVHILTTGQLASSASYVSAGLKVEVIGASAVSNNVYSGDFSGGLGLITDNLLITGALTIGTLSNIFSKYIDVFAGQVGNSVTGSEQVIYTKTIPANYFEDQTGFHIRAGLRTDTNNDPKEFSLKVGGQIIYTSIADSLNPNDGRFLVDFDFIRAGTSSVSVASVAGYSQISLGTFSNADFNVGVGVTGTYSWSSTIDVEITASASNVNDIELFSLKMYDIR